MTKERILIIEDEEDLQEILQYNLAKEGYRVRGVLTGEEGLAAAESDPPDLLLLDIMLPGQDGIEICRRLREAPATSEIPIVMITARGEDEDIVRGLEAGADDYVTKPFGIKVLISRMGAVLRRSRPGTAVETDVIERHGLLIHPGRHEVLVEGDPVSLTATEFRVLHALARRPGWVLTRGQLIDAVHGPDYPVTDRSIDVQIAGLRKKLGQAGKLIETVRGVGYRFED